MMATQEIKTAGAMDLRPAIRRMLEAPAPSYEEGNRSDAKKL